ncbi:hypothetical protein Droror1_Dr00017819 [Drosera rotundifolia]
MAIAAGNHRKHHESHSHTNQFLLCADLILPYLTPIELAAVSLVSKPLRLLASSITFSRSFDAARSLEQFPIPFINHHHHPYTFFVYTTSLLLPNHRLSRQFWGFGNINFDWDYSLTDLWGLIGVGCGCEGECGEDCECVEMGGGGDGVMMECGMWCGCGGRECGRRVTRRGVAVRVRIEWDRRKGWGLVAGEALRAGQYVCEYAGELLTTEETRKRQQKYDELASTGRFSSALLVVREHLPSRKACFRINIDATKIGNVARFINHSCDGGNLSTILVHNSGSLLPRVCFFASEDIKAGEELSFSYGDARLKSDGLKCFCGSSCCHGTLPSENT